MDGSERIVSRGKLNIIRVNINIFDLIGVGELSGLGRTTRSVAWEEEDFKCGNQLLKLCLSQG